MTVSAALVKELRERSGAGMMDCKKALVECDGNIEDASNFLRKKGLTKASKKSGRAASEGVIAYSATKNKIALFELNCETDFVTKNQQFIALAKQFASKALSFDSDDIEAFKSEQLDGGATVADTIVEGVMSIGENIQARRIGRLEVENGMISKYVHNAVAGEAEMGKIVVAVALSTSSDAAEVSEFGKHVAMHIAASKPESLNVESLDQSLVEKEKNFLKDQAASSGKPAEVIEKMIEGRIRKFYEENVLLEQVSMIDGKAKIKDLLSELSSKVGEQVEITGFVRFEVGEALS